MNLLPCPFCGAGAESDSHRSYRNLSSGAMETQMAIYCTSCSADIAICVADVPDVTIEQVVALWNARSP